MCVRAVLIAGMTLIFGNIPGALANSFIEGKVIGTLEAASYSYLQLKTKTGEIWAAVPKSQVKIGSEVKIENPMTMDGFESKTLKRKFERIVFGTLSGLNAGGSAHRPNAHGPSGPDHGPSGPEMTARPHGMKPITGPVNLSEYKVPKATGEDGLTIAELFASKVTLAASTSKGKKISVRGKVVKYSPGIMGRNWLHIRDGSGKVSDNNFDLTVSTVDQAKVGDVVLVKGTAKADRDIGAGYFYPVLIEDAKLEK
ncbi:MAG TPA: nucleotide-binding protein [Bdellovibrionota bacterium]|nr:nucleotide-binding protein [Bdellovibrionota bacterium]